MKSYHIIIVLGIMLQSCMYGYDKIDLKKVTEPVRLDTNDLMVFSQLRRHLISDSIKIIRHYEATAPLQSVWFSTNLYYLKQIDSPTYANLYAKLNGKHVDNIFINRNGNTIFTIKSNVQMHDDNYNETYEHQLFNSDCHCPIEGIFSNVDTVYIDSVINKEWSYRSFKEFTGH